MGIKCERYLTGDTHLKLVNGNDKVGRGIYCVNLLAGNTPLFKKNGKQLTNVSGVCGDQCEKCGCKDKCYAIRQQIFRSSERNLATWSDNTILATQDTERFFIELREYLNREVIGAVRYHAMGEIPSYEYLVGMIEVANEFPNVKFYTYTKRYDLVESVYGVMPFPDNLVINMSIWHKNYDNPLGFPEFIYDDGTEEDVARLPHCPAVDKNGHETGMTCSACKRCMNAKPGSKMAVYAH